MKRFKNILCVIEPDESSRHALQKAVTLAENNQASLTVASVIERIAPSANLPDDAPQSADIEAAISKERMQKIEPLLAPYNQRVALHTKLLAGTPFLAIIHEVVDNGHDLVIKTPERQDWLDTLFGSDDMHLLRKCPCPVWLARPRADRAYRKILAAVDIGEGHPADEAKKHHALNLKILELAASQAISEFAELHVVHVWEAAGESVMRGAFLRTPEQQVNDYVENVRSRHSYAVQRLMSALEASLGKDAIDYLKPSTHLIRGWARKEIPQLAKQLGADLVVMGTVGRTGVPGLIMGNTAETILNHIDCSVLALKPEGFVSPVQASAGDG
jgi:nucleotide-binding universal stress UspA family protein